VVWTPTGTTPSLSFCARIVGMAAACARQGLAAARAARDVPRTLTGAIAREHAPETEHAWAAIAILSLSPLLGDLKTWRAR
jgi:hypothetical protein